MNFNLSSILHNASLVSTSTPEDTELALTLAQEYTRTHNLIGELLRYAPLDDTQIVTWMNSDDPAHRQALASRETLPERHLAAIIANDPSIDVMCTVLSHHSVERQQLADLLERGSTRINNTILENWYRQQLLNRPAELLDVLTWALTHREKITILAKDATGDLCSNMSTARLHDLNHYLSNHTHIDPGPLFPRILDNENLHECQGLLRHILTSRYQRADATWSPASSTLTSWAARVHRDESFTPDQLTRNMLLDIAGEMGRRKGSALVQLADVSADLSEPPVADTIDSGRRETYHTILAAITAMTSRDDAHDLWLRVTSAELTTSQRYDLADHLSRMPLPADVVEALLTCDQITEYSHLALNQAEHVTPGSTWPVTHLHLLNADPRTAARALIAAGHSPDAASRLITKHATAGGSSHDLLIAVKAIADGHISTDGLDVISLPELTNLARLLGDPLNTHISRRIRRALEHLPDRALPTIDALWETWTGTLDELIETVAINLEPLTRTADANTPSARKVDNPTPDGGTMTTHHDTWLATTPWQTYDQALAEGTTSLTDEQFNHAIDNAPAAALTSSAAMRRMTRPQFERAVTRCPDVALAHQEHYLTESQAAWCRTKQEGRVPGAFPYTETSRAIWAPRNHTPNTPSIT